MSKAAQSAGKDSRSEELRVCNNSKLFSHPSSSLILERRQNTEKVLEVYVVGLQDVHGGVIPSLTDQTGGSEGSLEPCKMQEYVKQDIIHESHRVTQRLRYAKRHRCLTR